MSIHHIDGQQVYFVSFQGAGSLFTVADGKLTVVEPYKEGETAEASLNGMRKYIKGYINSKRREIRKVEAMLPLIRLSAEDHGPDCGCGIQDMIKDMEDALVTARKIITEGEAFLLDVAELMVNFGLTIENDKNEDSGVSAEANEERLQSILEMIRKPQNPQ